MKKEIICTVCPMGCEIEVEGSDKEVTSIKGFGCKRGEVYGNNEFLHPVRILTSTVKVAGQNELLAVRSEEPIPKELMMDCMKVIAEKTVCDTPIQRYDVVIPNICDSGINIVATSTVK